WGAGMNIGDATAEIEASALLANDASENDGGGAFRIGETTTLTISGSCIAGNTVGSGSGSGISNPDSGTADAENNWWGASGGANTSGADTTLGSVDYTPFLTSAPGSCTIQPNPTPTPTLPICPGGFTALLEEECPPTLEDYGVTAVDCGLASNVILAGTEATAEALKSQFGGDPAVDTFRRVMLNAAQSRTEIEFICSDDPGAYCETNNDVAPPLQAQITCYDDVQLTEYTVVHEYGHVFTGRMGGLVAGSTYYGVIDQPPLTGTPGTPAPLLRDSLTQDVLGNTANLQGTPDWVRGQRGWGSAASTPPAVPCNFQQDAYTVIDATGTATPGALVRERDETAADMFLNWVYREIGMGGFHNYSYFNITNCMTTPTPDFTAMPGDARYNFMETIVMPTLSTRVPTPTATP